MNRTSVYVAAAAMLIAACSPMELLAPKEGAVPSGVDLSGNWQIRPANMSDQRRVRDAIRNTDGVSDEEIFGRSPGQSASTGRSSARSGNRSRVRGGLVHVFLELGESLKITQTAHGLFISFDRSVVEEFRFGENRIVNVGEIEAQRVTGWEGDMLVVETLDRNRMKLTERFQLRENAQVLERTIILRSRSMEEETVVQLFDRNED